MLQPLTSRLSKLSSSELPRAAVDDTATLLSSCTASLSSVGLPTTCTVAFANEAPLVSSARAVFGMIGSELFSIHEL